MPGTGPRAKSTCIEAVVRDRLEAPHPYDRKDDCYSACDTGSPAGQLWFSMLTLLTPTGPYKGGWRDPPPLCLNRTADSKPHSNFSRDPIGFSGLFPTAAQQGESCVPFGLSSLGISSDAMPSQRITGQATDSWSHQLKRTYAHFCFRIYRNNVVLKS